jgi:recombination protein RecT
MNALVAFENQLRPLAPHFSQVLPASLPAERLMRTVMVSVERLPALLECDRQSLFNAAMSAAILGLEVDGVTGQAFLIPFAKRAQLVVGYKGYNTLGARAGLTITGSTVREGDEFDYEKGTNAFVRHKPLLNNKGRIVAAWACATALNRPPVVEVLSIDDLLAVKAKSPGAKRSDSPWNDTAIGFPAMCEKTAKRRLARSLPLNVMQLAARMDEAVDEEGKPAWIGRDGLVIEGKAEALADMQATDTPSAQDLIGGGLSLEDMARAAALRGEDVLKTFFKGRTKAEQERLRPMEAELIALYPKTEEVDP